MLFKLNRLEIEIDLYFLYFTIPYVGSGFISRDQRCFDSWRAIVEREKRLRKENPPIIS